MVETGDAFRRLGVERAGVIGEQRQVEFDGTAAESCCGANGPCEAERIEDGLDPALLGLCFVGSGKRGPFTLEDRSQLRQQPCDVLLGGRILRCVQFVEDALAEQRAWSAVRDPQP